MTERDVQILQRELIHAGFFKLERLSLRHRLHAGGWSRPLTRELVLRGPAAAVLPYDPGRDVVVLIRQFRIGAVDTAEPWLTELVAGMIGSDESAEDSIRREAREEAGLDIGELMPLSRHFTTPGGSSETIDIFCGRVDASNAGGIHGVSEENEDIRVVAMPATEAFALRRANRDVRDSSTVAALLWLELERDGLRRQWS